MFSVELLVYIYITVCVSMILFNIATIINSRRRDRRQLRRSDQLLEEMHARLGKLLDGEEMSKHEWRHMVHRLSNVEQLIAFDEAVDALRHEDQTAALRYLSFCAPAVAGLCFAYEKKSAMQKAYLAYFLAKYSEARFLKMFAADRFCRNLLGSDNLYCRENAMRAYYGYGDAKMLTEAIHLLDQNAHFYHGKLMTDGLLTFQGDHKELIELLWKQLRRLRNEIQLAILNYIRFYGGGYEERMLALLLEPHCDPELQYAAIRYLGKYPYPPARETLLYLAGNPDPSAWNAAAISVTSLASYPGPETIQTLKKALHHSNWYVRYNAAHSLELLNVSYVELSDILSGPDRYAREMLEYRMEERERREQEAPKRAEAEKEASPCLT